MKSNKYYSDKQEKLVAGAIGGKQVTGSGARPFHYGDVISDDWLVECKTHTEPGHSIFFDFNVWEKIQEEARVHQRSPILVTDDGSQKYENTWCVLQVHNIDLSEYSLYSMLKPTTKHLTFKLEDLNRIYELLDDDQLLYTKTKWGKSQVAIVPLRVLEEMIT